MLAKLQKDIKKKTAKKSYICLPHRAAIWVFYILQFDLKDN